MIFRPWVRYGFAGDESEIVFRYPMLPWEPEDGGVGGHAVAASGIAESYVIREDDIIRIELRVEEDELPFLRDWWKWSRKSGQTFLFRFDQDLASTEHEYWAHEPVWPDPITYRRDPEYLRVFRVPLALRKEVGAAITTTWGEF